MSDSEVNSGQLKAFIERIEHMMEEKKTIQEDIKDIFSEAKGVGFDPKIIKMIVKIRSMDKNERREQEEILDLYLSALGMG